MRRRIMAVAVAVAVVAVLVIVWQGCDSKSEPRRPVAEQKRDAPHKAAGNGGFQAGQPSNEMDSPPADE
jgi:hypothetical protein